MSKKILILCLALYSASLSMAQNAACDGARFKEPVFSTVKKTTVNYARAFTYEGIPEPLPDTVLLKMDIYEPMGDNAVARPVVILAHGGSFVTGDKNDMKTDCERFAKAGYVAATIQYRLYPALILGFPDSTDIIQAVVKAIGDMKAAVRYFRQDAATANLFKADTAHIFVGGYSAGAVTALHCGYLDTSDDVNTFVQVAINANGGIHGNTGSVANQSYSSRVSAVYNRSGGLQRRHWMDAGEVPVVSIHGTSDNTVFYESGLAAGIAYLEGSGLLHPYATGKGMDSYLEVVTGGDHVNMYFAGSPFEPQVNQFFNTALAKFEDITCATSGVYDTPKSSNNALNIVPNPAHDAFSIQYNPEDGAASLHIFDAMGRQVKTVLNYNTGQSVAIADLVAGHYNILLQVGTGKFTAGTLVKQ